MKTELLTFDEAKADILESGHKSAALYNKNGEKLIPFNNSKTDVKERLDEIEKRLNSRSTENDIYQIQAKHYGSRTRPAIYYVATKDYIETMHDEPIQLPEKQTNPVREVQAVQDKGHYTADEYHKLYKEKIELDYDLKAANDEIDRLTDIIEELESEQPESTGLLSDTNKEFFSGIAEQVLPLADKMLKQRDVNQQIELLKLQMQMNGGRQPGQQPPQQNGHDHPKMSDQETDFIDEQEEEHLDAMELLKQQNPQLYADTMRRLDEYYKDEEGDHEKQ